MIIIIIIIIIIKNKNNKKGDRLLGCHLDNTWGPPTGIL